MKIAYFECFAGASGDMILGSLIDAGLEVAQLKSELAKLNLSHYDLGAERVVKQGMGGTQALVHVEEDHHGHHHRHLQHIEEIIRNSGLDEGVKEKGIAVFGRLAAAEAKVHRTTIDKIHFHEVGAMDAILDVMGGVAGLALMGIDKVFCSALHVGAGTVKCAHGILPVPAPATLELVKGVPIYSNGVEGELLTPTGAAILTTLATDFGAMPSMAVEKVGYGAGTAERAIPNLLRLAIGEADDALGAYASERVVVLETNIDDMNLQIYDYLAARLVEMGAFDVFLSPLQMKKNRPGTLLTVVCPPEAMESFTDFLLSETTSIGLRWRIDQRLKTETTCREVQTQWGPVTCQVSSIGGGPENITPDYEDCRRVALEKNVPLRAVLDEVSSLCTKSLS